MMFQPRQRIFRLALGSAVLAAASLCCTPAWADKVLIVCSNESPEGFDIAQYTGAPSDDAAGQTLYDRLTEFERGTTRVIPGLAESWTISPDGLVYTFKLRHGVKFHTTEYFKPTRDFNADDVVFSLRRMVDSSYEWNKLARIGFKYATSMGLDKNIKSVEKVDDYTVKMTLGSPEAPMIANMAMTFASIFSAEYAAQLLKAGRPDDLNFKPVGTGPFMLTRYDKDAGIRYAAHPQYWRGRAKLDRLIFAITKDPAVRAQRLKAGECQFAMQIKQSDLPGLKADPSLNVIGTSGLLSTFLTLNVEHKPLDNKLVRQALNMAFDRDSFIKAEYGEGNAIPAINPFPPSMWGWAKDVKEYEYNPAKAKEMLAKAGYPNGFDLLLISRTSGGAAFPNPKLASELLQSDFRKIGVNVIIKPYDFGEMLKRSQAGEHDINLQAWAGDNGDPDNFMVLANCAGAHGGNNYARWCDKKYDGLLDKARITSNQAEREKLYIEAQKYFKDQAVWITFAHPKEFNAMKKNVVGYIETPFLNHNYYSVDIQ